MSVTLRKRKNKDGSTSLVLDIYYGGKRNYEFLNELKLSPSNALPDRQKNKENLDLAKRIQAKRAQELSANDYNIQTEHAKKVNLLAWMNSYIEGYSKKDLRNMKGVYGRFEEFLKKRKASDLFVKDLDENLVANSGTISQLSVKERGQSPIMPVLRKWSARRSGKN